MVLDLARSIGGFGFGYDVDKKMARFVRFYGHSSIIKVLKL